MYSLPPRASRRKSSTPLKSIALVIGLLLVSGALGAAVRLGYLNTDLLTGGSSEPPAFRYTSDIGVAILKAETAQAVGAHPAARQTAAEGTVFLVVRLAIENGRQTPFTLDGDLLQIEAGGDRYAYSLRAMTALLADDGGSLFLTAIPPGQAAEGQVAFEVPAAINLRRARLRFQADAAGEAVTLRLRP